MPLIVEFQPWFSKSVWKNAQSLLVGASLAIGHRAVTACLRVMGLSDDRHFQHYHRVLKRARWSTLAASRVRLRLLVSIFAPTKAAGTPTEQRGAPPVGLVSRVRLLAHSLIQDPTKIVRTAAWYAKEHPRLWRCAGAGELLFVEQVPFSNVVFGSGHRKNPPRSLLEHLTDAVCYAA